MKEHELVILTRALPEHQLEAGDIGTVVCIYENEKAFEVEFAAGSGDSIAVVTLEPKDIREFTGKEILHARPVAV